MLARLPRMAEYPKLTLLSCLRTGVASAQECSPEPPAGQPEPAQPHLQSPPVVAPWDLLPCVRLGPDSVLGSGFLLEPPIMLLKSCMSSFLAPERRTMQFPVVARTHCPAAHLNGRATGCDILEMPQCCTLRSASVEHLQACWSGWSG